MKGDKPYKIVTDRYGKKAIKIIREEPVVEKVEEPKEEVKTDEKTIAQDVKVETKQFETKKKDYQAKLEKINGVGEKTAKDIGCENLAKPNIAEAISIAKMERSERTKIDADWLLLRLAEEVEADLSDLYSENGALKSVHEWPKIWRTGLVGGLDVHQEYAYEEGEKVQDGVVMKLKISDRVKRLELIGKHVSVGAFVEKKEIKSTISLTHLTEEQLQAIINGEG